MNTRLLTGALGVMLALAPFTFAQDDRKPSPSRNAKERESRSTEVRNSRVSDDMRRAIEWERAKDRAAARWERREASHPTRYQNADRNADRTMDDNDSGRRVKDTKAPGARKDR